MEKAEILKRAQDYIAAEKDERFRKEVEDLVAKEDFKELEDRFYQTLEFGTGGLRGIMGGGTNRMNTLEINQATQGLVNYVKKAIDSRGGESLICNIQYLAIEEMVLQAKLKADKKKTTSKKKSQPKPSTIITNNFNAPISNFAQEQHIDNLTTK
jgi:hypothetical protein